MAPASAGRNALGARFVAALKNPALSDVTLRSECDGTATPAAKICLASCSPVFMKMLTGPFAETKETYVRSLEIGASASPQSPSLSVNCAFGGETLAAVVAFSASDEVPALESRSIELICEILEACEYYDISGLRLQAKTLLIQRVEDKAEDACVVLQSVWERWSADDFGAGFAGEVAEAALKEIDRSAETALANCGMMCERAMAMVLGREFIDADETELSRALLTWVSAGDGEERRTAGARLAEGLSLEKLSPSFLLEVVASSPWLIPRENVFDVFASYAIGAEAKGVFSSSRRMAKLFPKWCSTGTAVMSVANATGAAVGLLDRELDSGCWTWDLRVEEICETLGVGVTCGSVALEEHLGSQRCGYAYIRAGLSYTGGEIHHRKQGPTFKKGDDVRVTLDCDTGALFVNVNYIHSYQAFAAVGSSGNGNTFTPAVSLQDSARVRLLKFGELRKTP